MRPVEFAVSVAVIGCIIAGVIWFMQSNEEEPTTQTTIAQSVPEPPPQQVVRDELPETVPEPEAAPVDEPPAVPPPPPIVQAPQSLGDSDKPAQKAVQDISIKLSQWLTPREQVRKWVLLVDNVAAGKVPVQNLPVSFPMPPFTVTGNEQNRKLSDVNYPRTSPMVNALLDSDPELLARYYRGWLPLLEQAYAELGQSGSFDQRFREAMDRVLAVEPLERKEINLEQPSVFFKYKDQSLEQASDVDKLLWRMGPENTRRLQAFLTSLKQQLQ